LPIKSSFTVAFYGRTFFVELRITTLSANSSTEEKEKKKRRKEPSLWLQCRGIKDGS
jgi:hypothetical protein